MKVLVLTNKVPYPANDGSSIAMASIIDGLIKNKAEVSVLSINTKKHFKSDADTAQELPQEIQLYKVYHNTSVKPGSALVNLLTGEAYHVSRFYIRAYAKKLTQLLRENTFDIIQLEGLTMAVYLKEIRKHSQAKVVLRAHNVEHKIWQRHLKNESKGLKAEYLKIQTRRLANFEKKALNQVDGILPITEEDAGILKSLTSSTIPMLSLPCGIDVLNKKPCLHEGHTVDLAYLASFDWMPNVQGVEWFMNKVWPIVQKLRPETTFKLGGRHMPPLFKNYEHKGVQLHSDVNSMKEFICAGRLIIVPLLAGSGMRIKVIENMALGKCQVSTSIGAEGVKINPGTNILLADEPEEFARHIVNMLKDDVQRKYIQKEARKTIEEHYSNQNLGAKLCSFYNSIQ